MLNSGGKRASNIRIVDFTIEYASEFKRLNIEWMQHYWQPDESHDKILDDPQGLIINPGGAIAIALQDGVPVGTCALLNSGEGNYELAKMCVTHYVQGKGVGRLLTDQIIATARTLGAKRIYLKTVTALQAAISLYEKLGFKRLECYSNADTRCNIEMELWL